MWQGCMCQNSTLSETGEEEVVKDSIGLKA